MLCVVFIAQSDDPQAPTHRTDFILTATLCVTQLEVRTLAAFTQVESPPSDIAAQVPEILPLFDQQNNTCSSRFLRAISTG
jgi:hypothetical protein